MNYTTALVVLLFCLSCGEKKQTVETAIEKQDKNVTLMTLDPGHFHAALVQKTMYPQVNSTLFVFAPEGPEVNDFFDKIELYNTREVTPTHWELNPYLGADYLQVMLAQKPGNVVILAGKNSKKIDYILEAVKAGLNVYADKPLVINPEGLEKLQQAFELAEKNGVMIYDIMTERFESTTRMQKHFSMIPSVFGELIAGTPDEPAISKESVHHFFKYVSGQPLVRPPWFFDVNEEGEGIVDVTTHLVDLVQWEAFPEQIIDSGDVRMLTAKRWPTVLNKEEFAKVTGLLEYPEYLKKDVKDDGLNVFSNGEMVYRIKGKHAKVSVIWNYQAPEGTGDTHYSMMRGTKCNLIIKQGLEENFKPVLYIESNEANFEQRVNEALANEIALEFEGVTAEKIDQGTWRIAIPERYHVGHEAHFAQVTDNYLRYLEKGELPAWEIPNMKTKYYTTIAALKLARK